MVEESSSPREKPKEIRPMKIPTARVICIVVDRDLPFLLEEFLNPSWRDLGIHRDLMRDLSIMPLP